MPRDASPVPRSLNGLLAPTVSSRSFGPDPCTRTTPGQGPVPDGIVSVAGRDHSLDPRVISLSTNDDGFAYDGSVYGAAVLAVGRNTRPEILRALSNANWMSIVI